MWSTDSRFWNNPITKLGTRVAGFSAGYYLGHLAGDITEMIPAVSEAIYTTIDFASGVDVRGNLDGLFSLIGGAYGFLDSGVRQRDDRLEVKFFPLRFC